jgi:hypothetical protein
MDARDNMLDIEDLPSSDDNVIAFRPRAQQSACAEDAAGVINMQRYPVDIRGYVTFGRLLSGLSSVGLTVHIDSRSGRVVITDEVLE